MKKKKMKSSSAKKIIRTAAPKNRNASPLEDAYRQYIVPMPQENWSSITNLSQPSMLKQVPSKTAYSSAE